MEDIKYDFMGWLMVILMIVLFVLVPRKMKLKWDITRSSLKMEIQRCSNFQPTCRDL